MVEVERQNQQLKTRTTLNYANWASLSKAERLKHEQSRLKIQNDIAKQMNFSHRLVETQQLSQYQDFTMLSARETIDNEAKSIKHADNDDLMNSIQAQLNDIDKLLK